MSEAEAFGEILIQLLINLTRNIFRIDSKYNFEYIYKTHQCNMGMVHQLDEREGREREREREGERERRWKNPKR